MADELVATDGCVGATIDIERACLRLLLSFEHHNICLVVKKYVVFNLNTLPWLNKLYYLFNS